MSWPPDPAEVHKHDEKAHKEREGQKYNTPPPPCTCGKCDACKNKK